MKNPNGWEISVSFDWSPCLIHESSEICEEFGETYFHRKIKPQIVVWAITSDDGLWLSSQQQRWKWEYLFHRARQFYSEKGCALRLAELKKQNFKHLDLSTAKPKKYLFIEAKENE